MIRPLLFAALALSLAGCQQTAPPATMPAPVTPAAPAAVAKPADGCSTQWKSLFDGQSLAGWKVPEFGGDGKVEVKNGEMHIGMGAGCSGATYTGNVPRENFEIELEGERVDGHDFFCAVTFPVGADGKASWVLGGWGGSLVGISCIDGYDASDNTTTKTMNFEQNHWYRIRVRVTKAKIECFLDEEKLVDVEREGKKFDVRMEVEQNVPLGVATYQTHGALRNIRMRLVEE